MKTSHTLGMSNIGFAFFLFFFYVVCEVLPLGVLYYQHNKDFKISEQELIEDMQRIKSPNP